MNLSELFSLTLHAPYLDVEKNASFAVIGKRDTLYILFQWSRGGEDWKNNLDFPAVPYKDMPHRFLCHRGFLSVWKAAEPYIADILQETGYDKITVSGYSHGGALAMLCHEYIWFHHPEKRARLKSVGFGAPRVLWRLPGTLWPEKRFTTFTTVRNIDDIVTHLPPAILGYRHVGKLLEIGTEGRLSDIDAHRPENYREALTDYVTNNPTLHTGY